jgi:hypothetical protein
MIMPEWLIRHYNQHTQEGHIDATDQDHQYCHVTAQEVREAYYSSTPPNDEESEEDEDSDQEVPELQDRFDFVTDALEHYRSYRSICMGIDIEKVLPLLLMYEIAEVCPTNRSDFNKIKGADALPRGIITTCLEIVRMAVKKFDVKNKVKEDDEGKEEEEDDDHDEDESDESDEDKEDEDEEKVEEEDEDMDKDEGKKEDEHQTRTYTFGTDEIKRWGYKDQEKKVEKLYVHYRRGTTDEVVIQEVLVRHACHLLSISASSMVCYCRLHWKSLLCCRQILDPGRSCGR